MSGIDLHFDRISQECLAVLGTYAVREVTAKSCSPESSGWLDRVEEIPGVDARSLTMIHGVLIAQGLLRFEITGRSCGLQYQISSSGREALQRQSAETAESAASEPAASESAAA